MHGEEGSTLWVTGNTTHTIASLSFKHVEVGGNFQTKICTLGVSDIGGGGGGGGGGLEYDCVHVQA